MKKMHAPVSALLFAALLLTLGGCSKSLEKLADGDSPLAADAQAIRKALAKTKIEPEKVKAWENTGYTTTSSECDSDKPCAGIVVRNGRISHLYVRAAGGPIDMAALKGANALEHITLQNSVEGSLKDFGGLPKLRDLDLMGNSKLTSVVGLSKLPKLANIDLGLTGVTELRNLKDLPKLRKLNLKDSKLTTVSGLDNVGLAGLDFSKLKTLKVLEKITNMPRLIRISVKGNKLTSLSLTKLPVLSSLVVTKNALTTLSVTNMPKLKVINAKNNRLSTVTFSGLPALETLAFGHNAFTAIPAIVGAPKLKWFSISNNKLTSLAGLGKLNIKEVFVEHNALTSLSLAPAATTVEKPAKRAKRAKRKGGFAEPPSEAPASPKTVTLVADYNQLATLAGVGSFPALVYLYVSHNKLTSLSGVEKLAHLKKLQASHNKLKTLKPLKPGKLEELIATNNQIVAAPELFGTTGTSRPKIKRYDLRHNAIVGVGA
ncbi:MAG: hypothetical protein DRN14_06195, partial [Thermoplasmata archaeon]